MFDAIGMIFPWDILLSAKDSPQEALVIVIVLNIDARPFGFDRFREIDKGGCSQRIVSHNINTERYEVQ